MSENVAETMVRLFFDAERFHFERHGLTLDMSHDGGASDLVTVRARHDLTIADEVALMEVFMSKGHRGVHVVPQPC